MPFSSASTRLSTIRDSPRNSVAGITLRVLAAAARALLSASKRPSSSEAKRTRYSYKSRLLESFIYCNNTLVKNWRERSPPNGNAHYIKVMIVGPHLQIKACCQSRDGRIEQR